MYMSMGTFCTSLLLSPNYKWLRLMLLFGFLSIAHGNGPNSEHGRSEHEGGNTQAGKSNKLGLCAGGLCKYPV